MEMIPINKLVKPMRCLIIKKMISQLPDNIFSIFYSNMEKEDYYKDQKII